MLEEINSEVGGLCYLGTLENMFTFNGIPGHVIVQVYDGVLKKSGLYEQAVKRMLKSRSIPCRRDWMNLGEGESFLYPDGSLGLLNSRG